MAEIVATCGGCSATWTGTTKAHCAAEGCHRTFSGVTTFDDHRHHGTCANPPSRGLVLVDGVWRSNKENPFAVQRKRNGTT